MQDGWPDCDAIKRCVSINKVPRITNSFNSSKLKVNQNHCKKMALLLNCLHMCFLSEDLVQRILDSILHSINLSSKSPSVRVQRTLFSGFLV